MSKVNNYSNDYIVGTWKWYNNIVVGQVASNLVLTGNTNTLEAGGRLVSVETDRWYIGYVYYPYNNNPFRGVANMGDNTLITLGGNYGSSGNLNYDGNWVQDNVAAVRFQNGSGNGYVNFTAHTGADVVGTNQPNPDSSVSDAGIQIYVKNGVDDTDIPFVDQASRIDASMDVSAYGFRANGNLNLISDMSASIFTESGITHANNMRGYEYPSGTTIMCVNMSDNSFIEVAAFKAASVTFENNFTGTLNSQARINATAYAKATADGNTITAAGILATGEVSLTNGYWGGTIVSTNSNNNLLGDYNYTPDTLSGRDSLVASVSGNTIDVYGIKAGSLTLKEMNGSITAITERNTFRGVSAPGAAATSVRNLIDNTIAAAGIKANSITLTDDFSGTIRSENNYLWISDSGPAAKVVYGFTVTNHGLDVAGTISCGGNFKGALTVNQTDMNIADWVSTPSRTFGIESNRLEVREGYMSTDISINTVNTDNVVTTGIYSPYINMLAFTGTISITSTSSLQRASGIHVSQLTNDNDGIFDMAGDIDIGGSVMNAGLEGFSSGMSLRISGLIDVMPTNTFGYAVFAGLIQPATGSADEIAVIGGFDALLYDTNDYLELAAGSYIIGDIDLTNGENTMVIDSNARMNGTIDSSFGKLNLAFMLNDKTMAGVAPARAGAVIVSNDSGVALESVASITINLNDVVLDVDGNGDQIAKTYYLVDDNSAAKWLQRTVTFAYQGQMITARVGTTAIARDGSFTVTSGYDASGLYVTVEHLVGKPEYLTPVAHASWDDDAGTITISWDEISNIEKYELEYRIADAGGSYGNTITVMVDGGLNNFEIAGIEDGQSVEWRVRRHYGERTTFSNWTDTAEVVMGQHSSSIIDDQAVALINNPDSSLNTSSSVIEFQWSGFTCTDGLGHYEVRYYLTNDEDAPDWNAMAYGTTANYYHKYTTASELVISGFSNAEFVHWQVRAVDINGAQGDWIDGDLFRVFIGDNNPPVFLGARSTVTYDIHKAPDEDGFLKVTLTWDPAIDTDGKSGLRGYYIYYRESGSTAWLPLGMVPAGTNTFSYNLPNGVYEWQVFATDYAGNKSQTYTGLWNGDETPPIFTGTAVWTGVWDADTETVIFSGNWPRATDLGSGVEGYRLRYTDINGTGTWHTVIFDASTQGTSVVVQNGEYRWVLEAFDYAGNYTAIDSSANWVGDLVAPIFSTGFTPFSNVRTDGDGDTVVDFVWNTAYEAPTAIRTGFSYYKLCALIDGNTVTLATIYDQRVTKATIDASQYGLTPNNYTWWVESYDVGGNMSQEANQNFIIDVTPPSGSFGDTTSNVINATWATRYIINPNTKLPEQQYYISNITITLDFEASFTDDLSSVIYLVEVCDNANFIGSGLQTYYTSTDSLVFGDGTNGTVAAGELLGMKNVYWRVQAMDSSGNKAYTWLLGNNGNPFQLIDYNNLDDEGNPRKIIDNVDPVRIGGGVVMFTSSLEGDLNLSWDPGSDPLGVAYYKIRFYRKGGFPTDEPIIPADDPENYYSSNIATITKTSASTYIITTKTSDPWLALMNVADGIYDVDIKTYDYAGHSSEWVFLEENATIDVHGPTLNTRSVASQVAGRDVYFSWDPAIDLIGVDHYELVYKMFNEQTQVYEKVQTITISGSSTGFWLRNLENGYYSFTLQAFDKKLYESVIFGSDISPSSRFTVGSTGDGSNYRNNPTMITVGDTYNDAAGGSDQADYYAVTLDENSGVVFNFSNVAAVGGGKGGIRIAFYDENGKVVQSTTLSSGAKSYSFAWTAGTYTVGITPANASATTAFSFNTEVNPFPAPSLNDDEANFKNGTLAPHTLTDNPVTGNGELELSGWVGYQDAADYFYIDADRTGGVTVNLSGLESNLLVTLYDANKKKIKSVTMKADGVAFNNLLTGGAFYISVASPDKGKGAYNSNYVLDITEDYFPAANHQDDTFSGAQSFAIDGEGQLMIADWVGYQDGVDYFAITADRTSSLSLVMNDLQSNLVVTIYDQNRKRIKTVTVSEDGEFLSDLWIGSHFYLSVAAPDKGKGAYNSNYRIDFIADYVPADVTPNNSFSDAAAHPTTFAPNSTAEVEGWVGVGDPDDYYFFEAGPGRLGMTLTEVESKLKVSVYDERRQLVKSITVSRNGEYFTDLLMDGNFFVEISSADGGRGKNNSNYKLTVNASFFPTETYVNNTRITAGNLAQASGGGDPSSAQGVITPWDGAQAVVDDWVGFADSADYFEFELAQGGRLDFDLNLDDTSFRVGKQVKITLYNEDGKKLKLDRNLISGELEAGHYCVAVETSNEKRYSTGYRLEMALC